MKTETANARKIHALARSPSPDRRRPTAARRSETARSSSRVGVEVRRYGRPVDVSVSNPKSTPPSRRNVDRRNDPRTRPTSAASRTKPRACIYGPVCFAHSGVSGASASVRLKIRSHSARRASSGFVSVISLRNYLVNLGDLIWRIDPACGAHRGTGESPAAAPRPPSLTALSAPASPWRPTHRYTSSGGNGWTQTQTQRTTDTRTCLKGGRGPQTLTGPYPIAPRQRGPPHTGERMPRPEDHAISLISPPPVMQRWVGGHHATYRLPSGVVAPRDFP